MPSPMSARSLGTCDVVGERAAADGAHVDGQYGVARCADLFRHPLGGEKLTPVPLPVVETERLAGESLPVRYRQNDGGIHAAAQENDRHSFPVHVRTPASAG